MQLPAAVAGSEVALKSCDVTLFGKMLDYTFQRETSCRQSNHAGIFFHKKFVINIFIAKEALFSRPWS